MNLIKKFLGGEYSPLYGNFASLALLQATNFLLPLVTLPFLLRVIGTEKFGVVMYVQSFMLFFSVITDYSFNVSATRSAALHKNDKEFLSRLFSQVFGAKLLLCLFSLASVITIVSLIDSFRIHSQAYYLGCSIILGQALLPVWFYQGMEEMKYITIMNVTSKIVFTALIFFLIRRESDYPLILLFFGAGNVLSGVYGLVRIISKYKLVLRLPEREAMSDQLREGWHIFLSSFSIAVYSNANIFILGFFATDLVVGYYSIADRIINAIRQILAVFSLAVYPYVCRLTASGHALILSLFRRVYVPFSSMIFILCLGTCIFADTIILILAGQETPEAVHLLRILSVVPVVVGLNIPAYQILLAYNLKKSYSYVITIGSILNVTLNFALSGIFSATGTAISVVITELFITISLHLILSYKHPQYALRN